ncbi:MAG: hypothetical protein NTW86_30430 [Candidatus Sumerlaeota bacterium]|nr:hypothetical protein [Candidatus Sumerlaeota bacterium]
MKALEDEGVVKTLLGPRITLKDRQEGVVNIGSAASSGTTDAHSFFNLRCVPTILEDGSIQIKGHLEADRDYVGLSISRKADSDTQSQTIHQEFSRIVPSHPIGLCAVNGSRHQELTSGVPILRNLPLVGGLFRKTKTSTESVTTILFATARIVPLKA